MAWGWAEQLAGNGEERCVLVDGFESAIEINVNRQCLLIGKPTEPKKYNLRPNNALLNISCRCCRSFT